MFAGLLVIDLFIFIKTVITLKSPLAGESICVGSIPDSHVLAVLIYISTCNPDRSSVLTRQG